MRSILLATLALSPAMLCAQAIQPVQTQTFAPVVEARLAEPATAAADRAADTPTNPVRPVSTGVVAPRLLSTAEVEDSPVWGSHSFTRHSVVEVKLVVDKTGKPTDIQLLQPTGSEMDKNIVAAVSKFRYKPGTVSNQPTEVPVNLELNIVGTQLY